MLTPPETDHLRALLDRGPLAAESLTLAGDMAAYLSRRDVPAGGTLFDPATPVGTLYVLADGAVTQTMGASAQPWYHKDLAPGEFFGQRSLVQGQHQTEAVATVPSVVYGMPASALSLLLDRHPALREVLWKESLSSRLRSIPLFESLNDDEISWLSELMQELKLPAGSEVPLDTQQGLWIVNWGQVELAGPAAQLPSAPALPLGSEPQWIVTAGNFFFTLQQGAHFGGRCAATWARTVRESSLYFLPDRHFNRMLAALPAVRPMVDQPIDIPAELQKVRLFAGPGMGPRHRWHLAQYCAWAYVPPNQNISMQGSVGFSFVHLLAGAAMVTAVDDKGRMRPVHVLQPGESYGKSSLLESNRRDATVRAVAGRTAGPNAFPGAEILNLDRRDLQVAFAEAPELWHTGVSLFDQYRTLREQRPRYDWLDEGEYVIWTDRRHPWWLALPLILQVIGMLFFLLVVSLLMTSVFAASTQAVLLVDVLLFGLVCLPIIGYTIWNYEDDYYAVTNRRVTRHDREPFASDARIEAPLEMVQDVTTKSTLWGRLLGFGDVTIRTAAKVGSLVFQHVPGPAEVQDVITQAKSHAAVAVRGYTKESLRRGLMSNLRLALAVPDLDSLRALGENVKPQPFVTRLQRARQFLGIGRTRQPKIPTRVQGPSPLMRRMVAPLPEKWRAILLGPPPKAPKPLSGEIIWRKHWLNLVQRASGSLVLALVLFATGLAIAAFGEPFFGGAETGVLLAWLFLFAVAAFWFWYHLEDWRNDLYIVTDEKIIDVEKKPLALSSTQRESSLEVIQTVDAKQPTLWSRALNYGDVVIRTAAADEGFTFHMVGGPMLVQKTIFQKVDAYRRRQESKRIDERRRDVVEGLQVYHELNQDPQRGWR